MVINTGGTREGILIYDHSFVRSSKYVSIGLRTDITNVRFPPH